MSSTELVLQDPFVIPDDPKSVPRPIRSQMAFDLRKAGASYDVIAEKLGYKNALSAENAVRQVIERRYKPDDIQHVVYMELERLDALQLIAWRKAKEGDMGAIDRILKIMERRSKYLGLDQQEAQVTQVHNTAIIIGGSEDEYVASLQEARREALKALQAGET